MLIANPIYDVVFRYLMEDDRAAKLIIGALIGATVKELKFGATEKTIKYDGYPTVMRMDFAAVIETNKGETKQVIIELQKAKFYLEVMRFRRYLGKQYSEPNLKTEYIGKRGGIKIKGIPIIPIYILGEALTKKAIPVMRVGRHYIDVATNEIYDFRHEFIEALTHDAIFVQIPHLAGRRRTDLEQLLHIFDQSNITDTQRHFLNIVEANYPSRYQIVIRRLKEAMANKEVKDKMEAEDDFINLLRHNEREIAMAEQRADQEKERADREKQRAEREQKEKELERQRAEREKQRAEREQKEKELERQRAEREKQRADKAQAKIEEEAAIRKILIKKLAGFGMSLESIATTTKLTVEEVKTILEKE